MGLLEERAGLSGLVCAIAGGGGGLGRSACIDLAASGCAVALCDIDDQELQSAAEECRAVGADVLALGCDVRRPEELRAFFSMIERRFGRLDVLVNVVGGTFRSPFVEVSPKGREALVKANFTWVADSISLAAALMARGGGGSIVTLTSIEAHRAAPGFAVYGAMKAAVEHLTRSLAVELGPSGIRVNCIAPDFVPTEGLSRVAASAGSGGEIASSRAEDPGDRLTIPIGRKGTPEDVTNCVLFLASKLSQAVTGTTIHPDGGALAASGWMLWPDDGFTARPPAWVLEQISDPGGTRT